MEITVKFDRVLVAIILVFCLTDCTPQNGSQSAPLKSKYKSPDMQAAFVRELQSRNIPHSIDSDGAVVYSLRDRRKVDDASGVINKEYLRPGIHRTKTEMRDRLTALLTREKINFEKKTIDGKEWILWETDDDEKVHRLIEESESGVTREELELMK